MTTTTTGFATIENTEVVILDGSVMLKSAGAGNRALVTRQDIANRIGREPATKSDILEYVFQGGFFASTVNAARLLIVKGRG